MNTPRPGRAHRSGTFRVVSMLCVLALVVTAGWYTLRPEPKMHLTAEFSTAEGIFPGSRVAILGVDLGTVVAVEPDGTDVRVRMTLPEGTKLPADVHAYIMSPAVVSDRFVALGPAYTSGPALPDGARIPVGRTHAPITWGQLSRSVDTLLRALGPKGLNSDGGLGQLIHEAAKMLGGNGPEFRDMLTELTQASELVVGNSGDIDAVLKNLNSLAGLLANHNSTLDSLATAVGNAAKRFNAQRDDIADTIAALSEVLTKVRTLITEHGDKLAGDLDQLVNISTTLVAHQRDLAETLDTLPLALENFRRAVTPDNRLRIRLDVSTNLNQFDATAKLCGLFPIPLCSGKGVVNPIPFPPHLPDALGLGGGN